jgi:hypothetical protein
VQGTTAVTVLVMPLLSAPRAQLNGFYLKLPIPVMAAKAAFALSEPGRFWFYPTFRRKSWIKIKDFSLDTRPRQRMRREPKCPIILGPRCWLKSLRYLTKCASCGENLVIVAAITNPLEARRYLRHVGLPYDAPARAPPRSVQGEFEWEPWPDKHDLPDYHHAQSCDS